MRDTLRGLHYQEAPHQEVKLVRCARGAAKVVIVDLRPQSPTHRQWLGVELSPGNGRLVYVPAGFAQGYQTLVDETEVVYQMSHEYVPSASRGVRWDDPAFGIQWPVSERRLISERDKAWPDTGHPVNLPHRKQSERRPMLTLGHPNAIPVDERGARRAVKGARQTPLTPIVGRSCNGRLNCSRAE